MAQAKSIKAGDHVYFTVKRGTVPNARLIVVSTTNFTGMPDDERYVAGLVNRHAPKRRRVAQQRAAGTDTPSPTAGARRAQPNAEDSLMGACLMRVPTPCCFHEWELICCFFSPHSISHFFT